MKSEFHWDGETYAAANSIQSSVGESLINTVAQRTEIGEYGEIYFQYNASPTALSAFIQHGASRNAA